MRDYKNGKIYAIIDSDQTIVYIGVTTCQLNQLWSNIKTRLRRPPPYLQDALHSYLFRHKEQGHTLRLLETYTSSGTRDINNRARMWVIIFDPIVNRISKHQDMFKLITGINKTLLECPCCRHNTQG